MSLLEVPPFDALSGGGAPFDGFGPVLLEERITAGLESAAAIAMARIREVFDRDTPPTRDGIVELDGIIGEMWRTGWSPERANVNLFTTDFGALLMLALHRELGGECIFRSATDLSHASVWWAKRDVEAFPFHKALKALLNQHGEGMAFFFDALGRRVSG